MAGLRHLLKKRANPTDEETSDALIISNKNNTPSLSCAMTVLCGLSCQTATFDRDGRKVKETTASKSPGHGSAFPAGRRSQGNLSSVSARVLTPGRKHLSYIYDDVATRSSRVVLFSLFPHQLQPQLGEPICATRLQCNGTSRNRNVNPISVPNKWLRGSTSFLSL